MATGTYGGSITLASVSDGSSGQTLYTWIRYADDGQGTHMSPTPISTTKYIGIAYNKQSSTPSDNPSDYTWSKYVGQDGAPGKDGENGEDGRGITSVDIKYAIGDSGTVAPETGWQDSVPAVPQGKFLWTRTITTYSSGNPTTSYSVSFFGTDGDATVYDIQSGHEKIYKFFSSISSGIVYSPEAIAFQAYKIEEGQNILMDPNSEYDTDIAMAGHTTEFGHIWSFLNRLTGQKQDESGERANLLTIARTIGVDTVQFNFGKLNYYSVTEELGNTQADVELFNKFIKLLNEENIYFIYKIFTYHSHALEPASGDLLAMKAIPLEFGTSEDMARFALTANTIQMAVNNSKLVFDATNGLTIQNGGLRIISMDGTTTLMEYNPTGNALTIVGNGEFTGTVHATEGSFTGDVSANTLIAHGGDIGGFIIQNNGLYSKSGAVQTETGYNTDGSLIKLLGENGRIDAENINLGVGAHINKYIQLGSAFLWNPNDSDANNTLLEAGAVKLSQTGELKLGQITLNGPGSEIYGNSFSIKPDQANFSNINASGKISTVVFEQNHLQSVGGSMMFKPSYKIVEQSNNTLILDEEFLGNEGDYVYLVKADGSTIPGLIQIGFKRGNMVTVSTQLPAETLVSLIDLGTYGDLIIGINSNDNETNYLKPRGMTISEFYISGDGLLAKGDIAGTYVDVMVRGEDGSESLFASDGRIDTSQNPKVFLGDLDKSGINFMSDEITHKGFGLYSENVYLTGSLTTKVVSSSGPIFAGVNTLNGASATKFIGESGAVDDTSKIVFWAGSASTANADIQQSPFQITERGSLYAAQGLFEGAIITQSRIQGADIYAARIHGTGREDYNDYGLAFYDADDGLVFYSGDTEDETPPVEVFSIGTYGLKRGSKYFIRVDNNQVIFEGDAIHIPEYYTDTTQSYYLHLDKNQIFGSHTGDNDLEEIQANIKFSEQKLSMGLGRNNEDIVVDVDEIGLKSEVVRMNKTVLFGEQLKYEQVSNGYNLYVL